MMNCNRLLAFLICLLIFSSCTNTSSTKEENRRDSTLLNAADEHITNPLDQIWAHYTFTDNEVIQDSNRVDVDLYNYVGLIPQFSKEEIEASLKRLVTKTESSRLFFDFVKHKFPYYLNHPNSPLRNDIYFEQVLKAYQLSDSVSATGRLKDSLLLELIQKNQVGTQAANFSFVDTNGASKQLFGYDATYKLLVFYDPTCEHCNEVLNQMKSNVMLNKNIDNHKLQVLVVDPIGDYNNWKAYQSNMPKNWINGYDKTKTILSKSLYNIIAYPTIYLIDKENKVILKDVYLSDVDFFLSRS